MIPLRGARAPVSRSARTPTPAPVRGFRNGRTEPLWTALTRVVTGLVLAAVVGPNVSGCGSKGDATSITVFAAASLQPTFTAIAEQFEKENRGVAVDLNFAGSSELATQLTEGARADVFAAANTAQMEKVSAAKLLAGKPVRFATNTLVIVTAPGNPRKVESFADLARPGLAVVMCQEAVPCGAAAVKIEESTRIRVNAVSEEPDVTDVLGKVVSGQADAGLVYRTDAISAGDKVATVEFTEALQAVNTYPIAVLRDAPQPQLSQKFMDLVTGEVGRKILHRAGFGPVSASAEL